MFAPALSITEQSFVRFNAVISSSSAAAATWHKVDTKLSVLITFSVSFHNEQKSTWKQCMYFGKHVFRFVRYDLNTGINNQYVNLQTRRWMQTHAIRRMTQLAIVSSNKKNNFVLQNGINIIIFLMQHIKGYSRKFRLKHILFRKANKIETGMYGN